MNIDVIEITLPSLTTQKFQLSNQIQNYTTKNLSNARANNH